ncbi:MAG: hypothetical protein R2873_26865 [Caldilineaceae bacterium]
MTFDFWDLMLNPAFLITFGLVLAGFLPMLLSVWSTFVTNDDQDE